MLDLLIIGYKLCKVHSLFSIEKDISPFHKEVPGIA